jgi:energy-converting hydrogenase A subunit M
MKQDRSISIADQIPKLEETLGIEVGFFNKLSDEEDWALIIKLHALIESAVSELLTAAFNNTSLKDTFSMLELSNKRTGKMAFINALGLLGDAERRYISSLSELRNKLVHNIKNVNYQLHEEVEKMDKQQFQRFVHNYNTLATDVDDNIRNLFRHDPCQALWYGGMSVLGMIYLKHKGQV